MNLRRIVVATDESDAGREAVRAGLRLAARSTARLTVMRAVPVPAAPDLTGPSLGTVPVELDGDVVALERLQRWLDADVIPPGDRTSVDVSVTFGIPAIEICRFAERQGADLLILGRKPRSQMTRLLLGDTADSVARRSRIPGLFVPPGSGEFRQLLVALDGSARGMIVLTAACGFARGLGASLRIVTVECRPDGEPADLGSALPVGRSSQLRGRIGAVLGRELEAIKGARTAVEIRRGAIVPQILAEVEASHPDVLVFGYHRGGPPGMIEAGSTGRHLAHTAPCAVLTIPL
jgi:nucleotide-binding universal stress UspA family protein